MAAMMGEAAEVGDVVVVAGLETLFRAHYARLVRALAVVSGSQESAADAVQEAFVKAHVGWIRRVAINKLRDDHRRFGRKQRAMEQMKSEVRTESVDWSDGTDVAALLAALPRQQRLSMALFYVDNLSIADVAATLEISEGAVKFHLHQGRDRLRGLFAVQQEAQP